jgi:hypothetical protein
MKLIYGASESTWPEVVVMVVAAVVVVVVVVDWAVSLWLYIYRVDQQYGVFFSAIP